MTDHEGENGRGRMDKEKDQRNLRMENKRENGRFRVGGE